MDFPLIYGFNRSSEAGNDVFACSVFLGGCNFKCPYCMNKSLVNKEVEKPMDIKDILKEIEENGISTVFISGGEPTCAKLKELISLIEILKGKKCKIGLSTNGSNPEVLSKIIDKLCYVAMDVKTANVEIYSQIYNSNGDIFKKIYWSKHLLERKKMFNEYGFDYELRTTLYPPYFKNISEDILGFYEKELVSRKDKWVFQQFRRNKNMLSEESYGIIPFENEKIDQIVMEARKFCDNVELKFV